MWTKGVWFWAFLDFQLALGNNILPLGNDAGKYGNGSGTTRFEKIGENKFFRK